MKPKHDECNIKIPKRIAWTGCDGKLLSNELIEAQMEQAVEDERYEHAAKCKKELERRKRCYSGNYKSVTIWDFLAILLKSNDEKTTICQEDIKK